MFLWKTKTPALPDPEPVDIQTAPDVKHCIPAIDAYKLAVRSRDKQIQKLIKYLEEAIEIAASTNKFSCSTTLRYWFGETKKDLSNCHIAYETIKRHFETASYRVSRDYSPNNRWYLVSITWRHHGE